MNEMRRTLLLFVFAMSLVFLWDGWQKHTGQGSMFGPAPTAPVAAAPAAASAGQANQALLPATAGAAPTAPVAQPGLTEKDVIVMDTDLMQATFAKQGGSLVRLLLKGHVNQQDRTSSEMLFDYSATRTYWAQSGLIGAANQELPNQFTQMQWVGSEQRMADNAQQLVVRFESPVVNGVKLVKTYTIKRGSYAIEVKHDVVNTGTAAVAPFLFLQLLRDGNPPQDQNFFYSTFTGPGFYTAENKFKKIEFKDIAKNNAQFPNASPDGWVAMIQHYFVSAWIVPEAVERYFKFGKVSENLYTAATVLKLPSIAPGQTHSVAATLFAGPQLEKTLSDLAPGLSLVKDYGFLALLAKPLFWLLDKIHALLGNWGWSIVVLVLFLKLAFFKLNASAYRSMAKMKKVAPRLATLKEQFKDEPQKMQQEMMRIYKEEKVNPVGGCLPILLQMPFFIALYWVLSSTVEMRDAPWIFWITDLSVRDPYFILPLLMAGTSVLQIALNPKPADPMQAKMMWMMPLLFSVMFFFFPAGLVLYWLTNNILSIAQQYVINKKLGVA